MGNFDNACCSNQSDTVSFIENHFFRVYGEEDVDEPKLDAFNIINEMFEQYSLTLPSKIHYKGCSQKLIGCYLFLCGCDITNNKYDSSFTYSINTSIIPHKVNVEINSNQPHFYPTLGQFNEENLLVFGGKNSTSCELYSITLKKWRNIKSLPEERYGADCYIHNPNYTIYLFGGINSKTGGYYTSILSMTIPSFNSWNKIEVKEESYFACKRNFSAHCVFDKNTLLILGGETKNGDSKDIIVWKFDEEFNFTFMKTQLYLPLTQSFCINKEGKFNNKEKIIYCYEDKETFVMKIDMVSGKTEEIVLDTLNGETPDK
ncbi:MAG: hypothetical protein MJ252_03045 [archaeon]|nr:hypothetical protein [archaeon]